MEQTIFSNAWILIVFADKPKRLNKKFITCLTKNKIMLIPELKFTGFDLVPREYFF